MGTKKNNISNTQKRISWPYFVTWHFNFIFIYLLIIHKPLSKPKGSLTIWKGIDSDFQEIKFYYKIKLIIINNWTFFSPNIFIISSFSSFNWRLVGVYIFLPSQVKDDMAMMKLHAILLLIASCVLSIIIKILE